MASVISHIVPKEGQPTESATYPICGVYWEHPIKGDIIGIVSPPALRLRDNDTLTGNKKLLRHAYINLTVRSEGYDLPMQ